MRRMVLRVHQPQGVKKSTAEKAQVSSTAVVRAVPCVPEIEAVNVQ